VLSCLNKLNGRQALPTKEKGERMPKKIKNRFLKTILLSLSLCFSYTATSQVIETPSNLVKEIRAYRISQMSDAEIRKLWETAEEIRQKEEHDLQEERRQRAKQRAETLEKCKDVVFQAREERLCNAARSTFSILNIDMPDPRSREAIFEALILGRCNFMNDRRKLIQAKCLPPK
jgi:hypothetical protein